jgi:hypothetical protein
MTGNDQYRRRADAQRGADFTQIGCHPIPHIAGESWRGLHEKTRAAAVGDI